MANDDLRWWETTPLDRMTTEQWEDLCDGCGKCCLTKVSYEDGTTRACKIGCKLLDLKTATCTDYENRLRLGKNCYRVTIDNIDNPGFLPETCAYKLLKNGKPLYDWHHLISGSRETVVQAGMSAVGFVEVNEDAIGINNVYKYLGSTIDY